MWDSYPTDQTHSTVQAYLTYLTYLATEAQKHGISP